VIRAVLQKLRETGAPAPATAPVENRLTFAPWQRPVSFAGPTPGVSGLVAPGTVVAPDQSSRPSVAAIPPSAFRAPQSAVSRPAISAPPPGSPSASPITNSQSSITNGRPGSLFGWRFLGTAHGDYALFESPAGVVVLDRRAAQERVWFERLQAEFARGGVASQRLLFAVPVEFDAIASALLTDRLKWLAHHGLEVGEFGRNFFRIEAVPVWLDPEAAEAFLRDVLALVREGRLDEKNTRLADEELARLAAQKAVRLPGSVNEAEALALVAQLFACTQPHTSPAGRPTHFELNRGELAKRFGRQG